MDEEKLTKAQIKDQRKKERAEWEEKMEKQMKFGKYKRIGIWAIAAILTILCVWGLISLVGSSPSNQDLTLTAPKIANTDLSFGPTNAKVTLIEYADFECPSCKAQHPYVDQLQKDYKGRLRFIYRFFPLQQIHPNANLSSAAGYAAYQQGKFYEMSDLLFSNQDSWAVMSSDQARKTFISFAKSISLDINKFQQDMYNSSTIKFIQAEEDAGVAAGVQGTPTFFVNGKQIAIPSSYDDYKQAINNALAGK